MPEEPRDLANYELLHRSKSDTEHEATVRIPVGRATAWALDEATAAKIQNDLAILSEKFSLIARPLISDKGMESIVLTGLPSAIAKARPEVVDLLNFYRGKPQKSEEQMSDVHEPKSTSAAATIELPSHVKDLRQFQYHDHTADIIVHSWGSSLPEALAQVCVGMFNYMTPLEKVDIVRSVDVHATGHDMLDLLYHLLDEFLYMFSTEMHICRCIEITSFDEHKFSISARGYGEKMDLKKHEQGTEIKAITMHMMKILDPTSMLTEDGKQVRQDDAAMSDFPYEVYVLLDIWDGGFWKTEAVAPLKKDLTLHLLLVSFASDFQIFKTHGVLTGNLWPCSRSTTSRSKHRVNNPQFSCGWGILGCATSSLDAVRQLKSD